MRKRFAMALAPVLSASILLAGCDGGGVTAGIPPDAASAPAPVMPGENKSTKEIAKLGKPQAALPGMGGMPGMPKKK